MHALYNEDLYINLPYMKRNHKLHFDYETMILFANQNVLLYNPKFDS